MMNRTRRMPKLAAMVLPLLAAAGGGGESDSASGECQDVTLRLSHQWPAASGEDGDFRSLVAQKFADGVEEKTNGSLTVQIYPNSSLADATEQYDVMQQGAIDMSVFPLDYASGRVPEFSITLMPALVRSHAQAKAWQDAEIGQRVEEIMDENGSKPVVWIWNAGAIGAEGDPIASPDDVRSGMIMRAAGAYVEKMLKDAGAGITSMSSSEIYTAMQTGVLDAAVTSTGSFASYNLQEQVDSFTSPTQNTFWFMFEPLIISNKSYDKLCSEQQDAVMAVGEELQDFAYTASQEDDVRVEKVFSDAGVEVVQMDDAAFAQWETLAKKQWAKFASSVDNGQELLDMAKDVDAPAS